MWIITHDNVHEAGSNPAHTVPKSRDYLEKMSRKKNAARKHVFRLMHKGREMFRGVAYFENDASFAEILKPLDDFGRSEYDCDEIQYMVKDLSQTPTGKAVWNAIREGGGRQIDQFILNGRIRNMQTILTTYDVDSVCEIPSKTISVLLLAYDPGLK